MKYEQALLKLQAINQQHLLAYWDALGDAEKNALLSQIDSLNIPTLLTQQRHILNPTQYTTQTTTIEPFYDYIQADTLSDADLSTGKKLISAGSVGCLIVAGGSGSRMRFDGPKGAFPISLIKKKSLFQQLAEKTLAAGKQAGKDLHIAFMTSHQNNHDTMKFFKSHSYFGLKPEQVNFFVQDDLPLLDKSGNLFLEDASRIAVGPDGNGGALAHFVSSHVWEKWHGLGIKYVNFILIDNLFANPFDAGLVGFQDNHQAEIVMKCTARANAAEKVGVVAKKEGLIGVVEYFELPEKERGETTADGKLTYHCANLSLFSFSMDFIKKAAAVNLPLHVALKAVKQLKEGVSALSDEPNGWKSERFIFDLLQEAKNVRVLMFERKTCFAPLKNASGPDSPETVRQALLEHERQIIAEITGHAAPEKPIELDPQFYYPTPTLLKKWKGRKLPDTTYIES